MGASKDDQREARARTPLMERPPSLAPRMEQEFRRAVGTGEPCASKELVASDLKSAMNLMGADL